MIYLFITYENNFKISEKFKYAIYVSIIIYQERITNDCERLIVYIISINYDSAIKQFAIMTRILECM